MAGRTQLIQCGDRCVTSFDPETGKQLWTVDGPSEEFVATPTYSEKAGLVFISSSWPKQVLLAIRPDGSGDVTETHVVWSDNKGAPYVPSLIVAGDYLLSVNNGGTAFCYEAATGKVLWQEKLGRHHASPGPGRRPGLLHQRRRPDQRDQARPGIRARRAIRAGRVLLRLARDQRRPGLPARLQAPLLLRPETLAKTIHPLLAGERHPVRTACLGSTP